MIVMRVLLLKPPSQFIYLKKTDVANTVRQLF